MNAGPSDHEQQLEAERALARHGATARSRGVAVYRDIFDILREPVPVELPADFAARVAREARYRGAEGPDRWLSVALRAVLGVFLAWSLLPSLAALVSTIARPGPGSMLLVQAAAAFALASLAHAVMRRRGWMRRY